jgi:hypothetical protein
VPDAALVRPGGHHVGIGVDSVRDGHAAGRLAGRDRGGGVAVGVWLRGLEGGRIDDGRFGAVAVPFQNFFRRDVGAVAGVVENESEVFWDLFGEVSYLRSQIDWES